MKNNLNKKLLERYSRQIVLKDVGIKGQKNITDSKVLIVGAGGLGCPIADYLSRAGVGTIGIADFDKISLSNIQRQSLYDSKDIGIQKRIDSSRGFNFIREVGCLLIRQPIVVTTVATSIRIHTSNLFSVRRMSTVITRETIIPLVV